MKAVNSIDFTWLKSVTPGLPDGERNHTTIQALDIILRNAAYASNKISVSIL